MRQDKDDFIMKENTNGQEISIEDLNPTFLFTWKEPTCDETNYHSHDSRNSHMCLQEKESIELMMSFTL